jgi:DNA-binding NtrC family response regulator
LAHRALATCLVVDDEDAMRSLVIAVLERAGYRCFGAAETAAAVQVLDAEDVDCVLLDVSMPGRGGMGFLRDLQRDRPDLAVVMVTGFNDPLLAGEAFQEGAYGYVVKPFQAHELRLAVQNALERRVKY